MNLKNMPFITQGKTNLKYILIVVVLAVIVGGGILAWQYWCPIEKPQPIEESEDETAGKNCVDDDDCLVFGETGDCNCGCFNKNYQWQPGGKCFCATPTSCKCINGKCEGVFEESKEEAIKKLFAEKYDKEVSEITININKETEDHLMGGVKFGEGGPGEEGGFLAAKTNGDWRLVYDGIGAIFCSDIEPYNFPVEMAIECWDEETGKVRDRAGEACVNSGGEITTSLCCKSTGDYPNLCLIGPCGCSPDNSYEAKICDCGEGKCFDGNTCVPEVYSFNDCIKAGYPVMESYPRQCKTLDGRTFTEGEEHCIAPTGESMSLFEAMQIAIISECGDQLKDYLEFSMCNADTGTWWIDLDIEKEGCNPACVVNIATKEAGTNWRCMGVTD